MTNHFFVIFYNFSVFFGLSCIPICGYLYFITRERSLATLMFFQLSFLLFGSFNLVFYYQLQVIKDLQIEVLFSVAVNLVYLSVYFLWIRHCRLLQKKEWASRVFVALCIGSAVQWTLDNTFFMDESYNVLNFPASSVSIVFEAMLFCSMLYLVYKRRLMQSGSFYLRAQTLILLGFYLFLTVKDLRVLLFAYNLAHYAEDSFPVFAFVGFVANTLTLTYLLSLAVERSRQDAQTSRNKPMDSIPLVELGALYHLSGREQEVIELICRGYDNRQIGQALFISENTVKKHINAILRKTSAKTRVQLVCMVKLPDRQNGTQV